MKNIIFFLLIFSYSYAQEKKNTDFYAENIAQKEKKNNRIKPEYSIKLSDSIKETSGLIAFDDLLWTHNDDHDKTIYGLDSLGKIRKKIILTQAINQDWEEITQDSLYLYIGDFGNNYSGNRTDLHILKIDKKSFLGQNPIIEKIAFRYSDQTDFAAQKPNNTNFDCEAFVVSKDSIFLFTKQWKSSKSAIYALPNQTGNQIAQLKETFDTKGLVTGSVYLEDKKTVVLCGYSKIGKPFLYLLNNFKNNNFLSGNKRRIDLKLPFHQIEGITTKDGIHYFITNESLVRKPILNTPQQIHYLDLSPILGSH
ncbi:T9SS C-terminal target domain-containing protein [Flavobacterium sp. N2038]|uniref:T9SS C-terminal target domain-containing protein n=1 Tax=Flavobacterium sp. N2038 TaxID=2986829 RepID=UPI002224145F|nr:T9SS C-terminal target domain-containing protein [Flavobacterium sp. N2038]